MLFLNDYIIYMMIYEEESFFNMILILFIFFKKEKKRNVLRSSPPKKRNGIMQKLSTGVIRKIATRVTRSPIVKEVKDEFEQALLPDDEEDVIDRRPEHHNYNQNYYDKDKVGYEANLEPNNNAIQEVQEDKPKENRYDDENDNVMYHNQFMHTFNDELIDQESEIKKNWKWIFVAVPIVGIALIVFTFMIIRKKKRNIGNFDLVLNQFSPYFCFKSTYLLI